MEQIETDIFQVFLIFGWFFASGLGLWSLFSPWKYARRDFTYDVEDAAYYAVISPVFSASALSWVIFSCFTGHGGKLLMFTDTFYVPNT